MKLRSRYNSWLILLQVIMAIFLVFLGLNKGLLVLWLTALACLFAYAAMRYFSFRSFVKKEWGIEEKVIKIHSHKVSWTYLLALAVAAYQAFSEGGNEVIGLGIFMGWLIGDYLIQRIVSMDAPKKVIFDTDNNIHYLSEAYFFVPLEGVSDIKLNFNDTRLKFKTVNGRWKGFPIGYIEADPRLLRDFLIELAERLDSRLKSKLVGELFADGAHGLRVYDVLKTENRGDNPDDLFGDF